MGWERPAALLSLLLCAAAAQAQTGVMATIAGSTPLNGPPSRGFDGDGDLARKALFALANPQNDCDPNRFEQISHIAVDPAGGVFIADSANHRIRRVSPSGVVTTFAGTGERPAVDPRTCVPTGPIGDGGAATAARLYYPAGLAYDANGNLIVADQQNNRIRKVTPDGVITTIAGNGLHAFYAPGVPALSSGIDWPTAVAIDRNGLVYFSELHSGRVARIGADGRLTTVAGSGIPGFNGESGQATGVRLSNPTGIAFDATGNLYIADQGNHRVRKITPDGQLRTIAGARQGFAGDGGPAIDALLDRPADVITDSAGNVYVSDMNNHRVRRIDASGAIDTVAGDGAPVRGADGAPAISSSLNLPTGLAAAANDDVLVVDWGNALVRKIVFSGQPVISSSGLVSSASFLPGPIAGGALLTILGSNLAPSSALADTIPWPSELNGVIVRINGEPIPLQFVSAKQINAQVPDTLPKGDVPVVVTTPLGASSPEFLSIVDSAIAIFLQPGSNRALAFNRDGSVNGPEHAESRGGILTVFLTGLGSFTPESATIGGVEAVIQFLEPTPGSVGLTQAGVMIPDSVAPAPDTPIVFRSAGRSSNVAMVSIQ